MKNYISLNGRKIKLTPEQVAEMSKSLGISQVKLSDIALGDTFKVANYEFIVLEHSKDTTAVIMKDLYKTSVEFGKNNNFNGSNVDDICKSFAKEMEDNIGEANLIEHTVDLTSDDGLKDYGNVKRKMSLLTTELYRRYVYILDKYKIDKWWWTCTAYSTPAHDNDCWVKCVSPNGNIDYYNYGHVNGVRPFCILNSNIFVSKGE